MTLTVKTTLAAMKMPLVVEKDGQRYSLDIADDEQGTDLVITKEEVEGVGFKAADYDEMAAKYDPTKLKYGYNTVDGEEIYFIPNPALGLWINREKFNA